MESLRGSGDQAPSTWPSVLTRSTKRYDQCGRYTCNQVESKSVQPIIDELELTIDISQSGIAYIPQI